jgi:hypothetical protein
VDEKEGEEAEEVWRLAVAREFDLGCYAYATEKTGAI